jgi:Ca2+-binding RTX toxin-like protein
MNIRSSRVVAGSGARLTDQRFIGELEERRILALPCQGPDLSALVRELKAPFGLYLDPECADVLRPEASLWRHAPTAVQVMDGVVILDRPYRGTPAGQPLRLGDRELAAWFDAILESEYSRRSRTRKTRRAAAAALGVAALLASPVSAQITFDPDGNLDFPGTSGPDTFTLTVSPGGNVALNGSEVIPSNTGVPVPIPSLNGLTITGADGDDTLDISGFSGSGFPSGFGATLSGGNGTDSLVGGPFDDFLDGGPGGNNIFGNAGDDTLTGDGFLDGGPGRDRLIAGPNTELFLFDTFLSGAGTTASHTGFEEASLIGTPGNDTIDAFNFLGNVTITGGGGNDELFGSNAFGTNSMDGGAGNDTITGGGFADTLFGGGGNDTITGGAGDDLLDPGTGLDTLFGGSGNDTLISVDGGGTITGDAGTDLIRGNGDRDFFFGPISLSGGSGPPDTLSGIEAGDFTGGSGNNTFMWPEFTGSVQVDGMGGNDTIVGGFSADTIVGGPGDDTILGGLGDDSISGGDGIDTLLGDDGNDILDGGNDADSIGGGLGTDTLFGGAGDDTLTGGAGDDSLDGGTGTDRIFESGDNDFTLTLTLVSGIGTDALVGIDVAELIGGSGGNSLDASGFPGATTLTGGGGADTLLGGTGSDILSGGTGADLISGGPGADTIFGNDGNDRLLGGADNDSLTGGSGQDTLLGEGGDDILQDLSNPGLEGNDLFGGSGNDFLKMASPGILSGQIGDDLLEIEFSDLMFSRNEKSSAAAHLVIAGGAGDDTITTAGLLNITQEIDGDQELAATKTSADNDLLSVDGGGRATTVTGSAIAITGAAAITYANFEDVQTPNAVLANQSPAAVADAATTDEDTPVDIDVLANDSDSDGGTLSVQSVGAGTSGSTAITAGGTVLYTPNQDFNGSDSFDYTVADGQGGTAQGTVTVGVTAVNDAPSSVSVAVPADGASLGIEGDPATAFTASWNAGTDVDGDAVQYRWQLALTNVFGATDLVVNEDVGVQTSFQTTTGTLASALASAGVSAGSNATLFHRVVTRDGTTTTNGPASTLNLTANQGPAAVADAATTDEDTPVDIDVLANDSDSDGGTLSIQSVGAGTSGSTAITAGGTVLYTPNQDFNGSDSFAYTVADGQGGTAQGTVTVGVTAVNDAPSAVPVVSPADGSDLTIGGDPATVFSASWDAGSDVDGDALQYRWQLALTNAFTAQDLVVDQDVGSETTFQTTVGALADVLAIRGVTPGTSTTLFHRVIARDALTTTDGPASTLNLSINQAPSAGDDTATTDEDTPVDIDVLANDSDADGGTLSLQAVGAGTSGSTAITAGGTVLYTPNQDFNGSDSFDYTVADGQGGSAQGTVTVGVDPVNDAPSPVSVASPADGSSLRLEGDPATAFTASWDAGSDVDGDPLLYTWQLALADTFGPQDLLVDADVGSETTFQSDVGALAAALTSAGVATGSNATLFHRVVTRDGTVSTNGPVSTLDAVRGQVTGTEGTEIPSSFELLGNAPNPFSGATALYLDVAQAADLTLEVFDVLGQQVLRTRLGTFDAGARQRIPLDMSGSPSGLYVYVVTAGSGSSILWRSQRTMLLVR